MEGCAQKTNIETTKLYLIKCHLEMWKGCPGISVFEKSLTFIISTTRLILFWYKQICKQIYTDQLTVIITFKHKLSYFQFDAEKNKCDLVDCQSISDLVASI